MKPVFFGINIRLNSQLQRLSLSPVLLSLFLIAALVVFTAWDSDTTDSNS
jgi:putative effector of murein hydrolase